MCFTVACDVRAVYEDHWMDDLLAFLLAFPFSCEIDATWPLMAVWLSWRFGSHAGLALMRCAKPPLQSV